MEVLVVEKALNNLPHGARAVLATIVRTEGVTFRKPGAQMLMYDHGSRIGLLSGACLENQITEEVRAVLQDGVGRLIFFDLTGDHEALFGYGTGCPGKVWIWLELVTGKLTESEVACLCQTPGPESLQGHALIYDGDHPTLRRGQRIAWRRDGTVVSPLPLPQRFKEDLMAIVRQGTIDHWIWEDEEKKIKLLLQASHHAPRVHIFGHGADALRLLAHCHFMGWAVSLYDPKRESDEPLGLPANCRLIPHYELQIDSDTPASKQALVLMTHQYYRDLEILERLVESKIGFVGMLSSKHRVQTMNREFSKKLRDWLNDIVFAAPIGLDLGGRGLEDIALAIIAQLQHYFQKPSDRAKPQPTVRYLTAWSRDESFLNKRQHL